MPSVFYMDEILTEAQTLLKTGMTWTAKIVQKGDLAYWPQGAIADLAAKIPAVLLKPIQAEPQGIAEDLVTALAIETIHEFRVVIVDKFDPPNEDVVQKRITRAQDVANRFYSATKLDMGGTIAGFSFFQAWATRLIFQPPEDDLVARSKDQQLFAVAVDIAVRGEADRL